MADRTKKKTSKRKAKRDDTQAEGTVSQAKARQAMAEEEETGVAELPAAIEALVEAPSISAEAVTQTKQRPVAGTVLERLMTTSPFRAKVIYHIVKRMRS